MAVSCASGLEIEELSCSPCTSVRLAKSAAVFLRGTVQTPGRIDGIYQSI